MRIIEIINSNPTENDVGDIGLTTDDHEACTIYGNTSSMCIESMYENESEYRLNSGDKNEQAIHEIEPSESKQQ
jgi:hypothetical protein